MSNNFFTYKAWGRPACNNHSSREIPLSHLLLPCAATDFHLRPPELQPVLRPYVRDGVFQSKRVRQRCAGFLVPAHQPIIVAQHVFPLGNLDLLTAGPSTGVELARDAYRLQTLGAHHRPGTLMAGSVTLVAGDGSKLYQNSGT